MTASPNQIALRPMIEADLPAKVRWANDPRVNELVGASERVDLEGTRRWFAGQQANPRIVLYTITLEGQQIGWAKLVRDEEDGREGEYYGMVIEPELWGRGLGRATSREVLKTVFAVEGWTRCWCQIGTWNQRSLSLHQSLGFEPYGKTERRRRHVDGTEHDVLLLAMTAEQWAKRAQELG